MTEEQFKLECGTCSDEQVLDALCAHFNSIGWHDAVRLVQDLSFSQDDERAVDDAETEGWESAAREAIRLIEAAEIPKKHIKTAVLALQENLLA